MTQYNLKKQLKIAVLEEFRGDDLDDHDPAKYVDYLDAIDRREVNQCCLCNHIGIDVNHFHSWHVGGQGDKAAPWCDNPLECIARVELNKAREKYRNE